MIHTLTRIGIATTIAAGSSTRHRLQTAVTGIGWGTIPVMPMRTRAIYPVLCLILLLAGCGYGPKPHPGWSGATGGEQLERQFWKDMKAGNIDQLQNHMATSWVALLSTGRFDRAATLNLIRQLKITDYTLGDFTVTPNGLDMVVTYTAMMKGTLNGQPLPEKPMKMMTIWQHAERGWMAIAHADVR